MWRDLGAVPGQDVVKGEALGLTAVTVDAPRNLGLHLMDPGRCVGLNPKRPGDGRAAATPNLRLPAP